MSYVGIMKKKMEAIIICWGYLGIMKKKIETTIIWPKFSRYARPYCLALLVDSCNSPSPDSTSTRQDKDSNEKEIKERDKTIHDKARKRLYL